MNLSEKAKARLITAIARKEEALEIISAINASQFKNAATFYVDPDGDDVLGNGSSTAPYQAIQKALDQCTDYNQKYNVILGTGTYTGSAIVWPGNVSCFSFGAATIQNQLQYTATDGAEEAFVFNGLGVADFQMDLTQTTGFALPVLTNGSYSITRIDPTAGSQFVQVSDSSINALDLRGALSASNVIFLGSVVLKAGANLLLDACVFGASATMEDDASCTIIGSVFPGSFTGPNTTSVKIDSTSSLYGGTITGPEIIYSDNSNTMKYTPANSSDWVNPQPKTIQEALDRIAASGGPIP